MASLVKSPVLAWLLVAAWALFVLGLGSDAFSANSTSRFLGPLVEWLFPGLGPEQREALLHGIRTSAHAVEYGVLAALALRAHALTAPGRFLRHAGVALALVGAVAAADEARQARSATRTGALGDVALDLTGGVLGVGAMAFLRRGEQRP